MAAPTVISVYPLNQATGVVLGSPVTVLFNQAMDITTVNEGTFSLLGPGSTQILTPESMLNADPAAIQQSTVVVPGAFSWSSDHTTLTFNPTAPLDQNKTYQVLVLGADGVVSADGVKSATAEAMGHTYVWEFSTGDLAITIPPPASPLPSQITYIDPSSIVVIPRSVVGNNLSTIDIVFPSDIDPGSFSLSDILLSLEAVLGDPYVVVPAGLSAAAVVTGNKVRITITGWQN